MDSEEHWILTPSNIIWFVVTVLLFGVAGGFWYQANHYKKLDVSMSKQVNKLQSQVDKLTAKNSRTIYLPKAGDVKMSSEQEKSVQYLSDFFSKVTDFSSQVGYNTNYQMAKRAGIHDPKFWSGFMESPYDKDGTPVVSAENIRLKNVRTQTIVTGPDTYIVTATYIPYHNTSDLYQEKSLETRTYVFDVQGKVGNWTKMQLMTNVDMDAQSILAGDLEN